MNKILLALFIWTSMLPAQWTALNTGTAQNLRSVYLINNFEAFACGQGGTIIKTTDGGSNWIQQVSGTSNELRSVYFFNSATGIICGYGGLILRTTNSGTNWVTVPGGTTSQLLSISFYNEQNGICAGNSGVTIYTTNGGLSWLTGQPSGYLVTFYSTFMLNAQTGYCGGVNTIFSPLLAKTTDGGANWIYSSFYVNNNEATLQGIHFTTSLDGFAVSNLWNSQGGISRTTNGGVNWTHQVIASALYGIDFFDVYAGYIVGYNGTILRTTDSGNNWVQQTSGSTAFLRSVDFIDSAYGFAAGDGGVILKTTNGGTVGIKPVSSVNPEQFELYQNYPNPFNPSTTIRFSIPAPSSSERAWVRLIIYNAIGSEIQMLVNEQLQPGTYEVDWDGSNFASGVYYYTLTTGVSASLSTGYTETRKMILIK